MMLWMRAKLGWMGCGITLAAIGGSACAMSTPPAPAVQCSVTGVEKLPGSLGGPDGVCRTIRSIAGPAAAEAKQSATVVIDVHTPSAATARITMADGSARTAPRIDVSDHMLTARSIEMLARSVADSIRNGPNPRD